MEELQGPINHCLLGEQLDVGRLEEENAAIDHLTDYGQCLNPESLRFEDFTNDQQQQKQQQQQQQQSPHSYAVPSLADKMPFLQMLQQAGFGCPPIQLYQDPSFQLLLRLHQGQEEDHKKLQPWEINHHHHNHNPVTTTGPAANSICSFLVNANERDSCVTNEIMVELCSSSSPAKSKTKELVMNETNPPNFSENLSSGHNQLEEKKANSKARGKPKQPQLHAKPPLMAKERKKRKRTRPTKNKEEIENQRMTHIAVERNRRRQMNDHLNSLRSLMPPSYIQRGDQASIIGGAIDFVKELEQLLQSLQAQKRMRQLSEESSGNVSVSATASSSSTASSSNLLSNLFMSSTTSPFQPTSSHDNNNSSNDDDGSGMCLAAAAGGGGRGGEGGEFMVENRSSLADVAVVVIHNHVSLKVQCQRKSGQLMKAILALEDVRLSVLHLNITSLNSLVHYSFNLKVEDDCKLRSADDIARAVHQIFNLINDLDT